MSSHWKESIILGKDHDLGEIIRKQYQVYCPFSNQEWWGMTYADFVAAANGDKTIEIKRIDDSTFFNWRQSLTLPQTQTLGPIRYLREKSFPYYVDDKYQGHRTMMMYDDTKGGVSPIGPDQYDYLKTKFDIQIEWESPSVADPTVGSKRTASWDLPEAEYRLKKKRGEYLHPDTDLMRLLNRPTHVTRDS